METRFTPEHRMVRTSSHYISSSNEDVMVKRIMQTHFPDGSSVDSESLMFMVEDILRQSCDPNLLVSEATRIANGGDGTQSVCVHASEVKTIYRLSYEVMSRCFGEGNQHAATMALLDSLGNNPWDEKVALVLAAFAITYGEFLLVKQLCPSNPLATSIATFMQVFHYLQQDKETLQPCFKVLNCLAKTLINAARSIIEFESLPMEYITLNIEAFAATKTCLHLAAYWVIRSAVACSSLITDLITRSHDHVKKNRVGMIWELWSLAYKVNMTHEQLRKHLDAWDHYIDEKIMTELTYVFEKRHFDNQEVLKILFSVKKGPTIQRASSPGKFDLEVLRDKEVILVISELALPPKQLLLLAQQTSVPLQNENDRSYEVVWIPFASSSLWSEDEMRIFHHLASSLPWYSLSQPWLLWPAVVNYIKQSWHFEHDPLMVILDQQGRVSSQDATDMIMIWGSKAYPFSAWREEELWVKENWSLQFVMDHVDPLASQLVEEGRTICIYGSNNLEWIKEFLSKIKDIKREGLQLELLYVGSSCSVERNASEILNFIAGEKLSRYLSEIEKYFFWTRLVAMRSSKERLGKNQKHDIIMQEVVSLLRSDESGEGWALIGKGSSTDILQLQGSVLIELLGLYQIWGEDVEKVGFSSAMRNAIDRPQLIKHCDHQKIVPHDEGYLFCEECRTPMKKFDLYQCSDRKI